MKVHRTKHTENFTILPNAALRDERLSYRARGVLMELLSRPEDWQATADSLSRAAKKQRGKKGEGRDAMRGAFAELKAAGYIVASRVDGEGGTHMTELHVYDVAQDVTSEDEQNPRSDRGTENQSSENQASVDQSSENQASLRRTGDGRTDTKDCSTKDYSSSSVPVTPEPEPAPAPKKKTNKSPEDIVIERTGCTPEEAAAVVTYINQQGDGRGGRIRSLSWWVENRDIHTLRQDLAMVRGSQTAAGVSYDSDPGKYLRSINGGGYRPYKNPENQDVYDEPLLPPTQPAKNGVKGGVRGEVAPQATYDQLADMPEEDALARFMFGEQPA